MNEQECLQSGPWLHPGLLLGTHVMVLHAKDAKRWETLKHTDTPFNIRISQTNEEKCQEYTLALEYSLLLQRLKHIKQSEQITGTPYNSRVKSLYKH